MEQFNKKLEENGLEEEKINLKGLNGVGKEKNKVNYLKNLTKPGKNNSKIITVRDLE